MPITEAGGNQQTGGSTNPASLQEQGRVWTKGAKRAAQNQSGPGAQSNLQKSTVYDHGSKALPGEARAAAKRGAQAERGIFGSAAVQGSKPGRGDPPMTGMDAFKLEKAIKAGKNVVVAGFSSQGGGHTERMLKPLGQALSKGDTVVLALPPHWENDKANEAKHLKSYKKEYIDAGVNVVTVQSDKAIWGFYKDDGPSDNFRILEEFAMKPQRDTDQTPLYGHAQENARKGQGFRHKDILQQVVNTVGEKHIDQIKVFEDMDPYLGKAADKAGIPKKQIVGQSNHVLLLDADNYLQGKSDAFLVKANGNGYNGKMATVDFDANVNKTAALGLSLEKFEVSADDTTVAMRKKVLATFMDHGNKISPNDATDTDKSGSVLVAPKATAETINKGVYLYLNSYTTPLTEHIKEQLKREDSADNPLTKAYQETMFVVSGGGAFSQKYKDEEDDNGNKKNLSNAMHMAQVGNFDGVISAGFGTASEMVDLIENNAYEGNFIVMPVEQQHEQEANAFKLLPDSLSDENRNRVETAQTTQDLKTQLDRLVQERATTTEALEQAGSTMDTMLSVTRRPGSIFDKAAGLLQGTVQMSDLDAKLLTENNTRASDVDRKEARELNKVMIPVLEALTKSEETATIKLDLDTPAQTIIVADVVAALDNRDRSALARLTGVNVTGAQSTQLTEQFAAGLNFIMDQPEGAERKEAADVYRRGEYANNVYTVGY